MKAKERVRLLNEARRRLGISQVSKRLVWAAAAKVMALPTPATNDGGYGLLAAFLRTNCVIPRGQILIRNLPEAKKLRTPKKCTAKTPNFAASDAFLDTFEWRQLRMIVLKKRGPRCECCGAKAPDVRINVDHIKPRRHYPELALTESNLQILCEVCNHGKGSWDETDWRASSGTAQGEALGLPIPGTATATSTNSSDLPRLVSRR